MAAARSAWGGPFCEMVTWVGLRLGYPILYDVLFQVVLVGAILSNT